VLFIYKYSHENVIKMYIRTNDVSTFVHKYENGPVTIKHLL